MITLALVVLALVLVVALVGTCYLASRSLFGYLIYGNCISTLLEVIGSIFQAIVDANR